MDTDTNRRRTLAFLGASLLLPATPILADDRPLTPRMTEGPFYPRSFPPDVDADLTRVAGRSAVARGTILDVTGRIVDRSGKPLAQAKLEVWQCDDGGTYHHVGHEGGDANFQGFGVAATDAEGRYRFRTVRPAPYPGRTPHIHFLVRDGKGSRLVSQMFFEGDPGNARDGLYRYLGAQARLVTMKLADAPAASGAKLAGSLDIVVA